METFEQLKPKIIKALTDKAPALKCAACGRPSLILVDGFFNRSLNKEVTAAMIVGVPVVPTIALVCKECGHMMEFSVGALGLLANEENASAKEEKTT